MSELRMNAYYYAFEPTGVVAVDRILSAVAAAGKAYHHTEYWCDPGENGLSQIDYIQQSAVDAAAAVTSARTEARKAALEEILAWVDEHGTPLGNGWEVVLAVPAQELRDAIRSLIGTDPATDREEG